MLEVFGSLLCGSNLMTGWVTSLLMSFICGACMCI